MMGVSKDMRSSDSSRKAFVPKVREISAVANWSISISVFRKRCRAPLMAGC